MSLSTLPSPDDVFERFQKPLVLGDEVVNALRCCILMKADRSTGYPLQIDLSEVCARLPENLRQDKREIDAAVVDIFHHDCRLRMKRIDRSHTDYTNWNLVSYDILGPAEL